MPGSRPRAARRSGRWRWNGRSPSRCIPNTAPCRWSGTCRRCRRSRRRPRPARWASTAACRTFARCAFRCDYLANLLTAGDEAPVAHGLERMLAMRAYMRAKTVDGVIDEAIAAQGRPDRPADRGDVPHHGDRQLRGPLRHPDGPPRGHRGRLRAARRLRLLLRRRLLAGDDGGQPVRRRQAARTTSRDGGRADEDAQGSLRAACPTRAPNSSRPADELKAGDRRRGRPAAAAARGAASA